MQPVKAPWYYSWWTKNIVLALLTYLLVPLAIHTSESYSWLLSMYARHNLETARQYPDLSYDDKMRARLGADYSFLTFVRDNTPQDAVILYPSGNDMRDSIQGQPSIFQGNLCEKLSLIRTLYPRRVILPHEMGTSPWGRKVTHVVVVGRHGADWLPYAVDSSFVIGVLPMQRTQPETLMNQ